MTLREAVCTVGFPAGNHGELQSPFKDGNLLVIQSDSEDSIGARRSGKTGQLADAKQEAETVTKEEEAAAVPARRKGGIKEQGGSDQCAIKASGSQEPPKASAGSAAVDGIPGELPLVLPEKIPQNRMIVELQDVPQRSMDLSGDSGAIGRLLVTGKKGQEQMQVDLKGVVFSACIVPAPATLAVLHLTSSEAKVESLSSCYVQLRESCEAGQQQGDADDGERYAHLFAPSQHEPDYSQPLPQGSGPDAEKKHRPKAEGAGKKAAKRPRPASKPTSKPGLKPAGVAKKSGSKKSASKPSKGRKPAS